MAEMHASRLVRWALVAWPERLRLNAQHEIAALHDARVADARTRYGPLASLAVSAIDLTGIAIAGVRARHSARLTRYKQPHYMKELPIMETLLQDVRYAFSFMRRRPGGPFLSMLTIALGIGAATAMYSIVDGVLLRPLPFEGADRLMSVYPTIEDWRNNPVLMSSADHGVFSPPELADWQARQKSFERTAGYTRGNTTLTGVGAPSRFELSQGTIDLFTMLRIQPVIGRLLVPEDWSPGATPMLLTYETWIKRFNASRDVVGNTVIVGGKPRKIIGVLPQAFSELNLPGDAWTLMSGAAKEDERRNHFIHVLGSLKPGVTPERAAAETSSIMQGLSKIGSHDITHFAHVVPWLAEQTATIRKPLLLLFAATAVLLIAACINVAGLLLGAGIDRSAELAVRSALGGARTRIARQLLTESMVLAVCGGAAGVFAAIVITKALVAMAPPDLPRIDTVHLNIRVMSFAFAATCAVGMLFGIIPAASLSKAKLLDRMGSARVTSSGRARLHSLLVSLQLALAMLLLGGAGLLVHTMRALNRVDPGFQTEHLLAIELYPRYGDFKTTEAGNAYYDEIRNAIARTPGVTDIAFSSFLPFTDDHASNDVKPEGYTPAKGEVLDATRHYVSGNYFSLMGMHIVDGRPLAMSDDHVNGPHIAVVGEQFAKHFWPGQSAIGKTFEHWSNKFTIVGVVADSKDRTLDEPGDILDFYMPQGPEGSALGDAILVKTSKDPASLINEIRRNIWSVDKDLPITRIQPMTEMVAATITAQRYRATLITSFAALSLLFSLLGVYGVVNRAVSGRMREMGLRLALGARPQSLVFMVLGHGMRLAVIGLITGVLALAGATKLLSAFLFGTKPLDPMAIGTVSLILLALTAAAVLPPSLRAARAVALNALRAPD